MKKAQGTAKKEPAASDTWSDILLVETPEPTLSYRTGLLTYEESLTKGQFVEAV